MYKVSNYGNVISFNLMFHKEPILLKQVVDKDGYKKVGLTKNGRTKRFFVHRLVATAFIENPNNFPVINHKDENPGNNNMDNLEWCTVRYNTVYNGMPDRRAKSLRRPVIQMDKEGRYIKRWRGISDVERTLGMNHRNIISVCKGRRKTAYGYKWMYEIETSTNQL